MTRHASGTLKRIAVIFAVIGAPAMAKDTGFQQPQPAMRDPLEAAMQQNPIYRFSRDLQSKEIRGEIDKLEALERFSEFYRNADPKAMQQYNEWLDRAMGADPLQLPK